MKHHSIRHSAGFTLIELMIALVLGLLVSAAALQLLFTGQRTLMVQQGSSEVQDGASFGLNSMVDHIQQANLGANTTNTGTTSPVSVTASQQSAGIVLATGNFAANGTWGANGAVTPVSGATTGMVSSALLTADNTNTNSDQLTIQYAVPQIVLNQTGVEQLKDCEGNNIGSQQATAPTAADTTNYLVTERYYIEKDANGANGDFALNCKAVTVDRNATSVPSVANLANTGQILIPRVDHFHVLLGVLGKDSAGKPSIVYQTITQYASNNTLPIVSVQIALLVRSQQSTGTSQTDIASTNMLGQTVTVNAPSGSATKHFVRQVYTRTIALNNGRAS